MSKDFGAKLSLTLISGLFLIGIGISSYFAHKLDFQSGQLANLNAKIAILLADFSKKNPKINVDALVNFAVEKNIPPSVTVNAIQALESGRAEGEVFMKKQLNFNPSEINEVLSPNKEWQQNSP